MAKRKTVEPGFNYDVPIPTSDPRIQRAISMYLEGTKKYEIAKNLNVHRKTISRWFKKMNEISVDVEGDEYYSAFVTALEEHGDLLRCQKLMLMEAFQSGDRQTGYAYERRLESSLKRRDKAIESFGVKFKSKLENENEELKTLCSWLLIVAQRLEDNLYALHSAEPEPYSDPFDIETNEIDKVRQCPDMFQIERYFEGFKKANGTSYMDSYDLEMIVLKLSLYDPNFDPLTDNPVRFASNKIFKN